MKTFEKILIANRGEIALRVIKAAQKLGIHTTAIYAEDDATSLHVSLADEAILLHGNTLNDTYLNQKQIIGIALNKGVQAIHPGYGFLAENADFAESINKAGLIFIGPSPENIRLMGEKNQALSYVRSLGIPVLPSLRGTKEQIFEKAKGLSFPVIVKASSGGGGKGMIICDKAEELMEALEKAERQALSYFGNGELFVEKYLSRARHVEVQLVGDNFGNVLHFYERECSVQRHFQKIIEEAPSLSVNDQLRDKLTSTALEIARSINYSNAGTIEFLLDEDGNFYFLEMNTRIQVEHPVTEMVTQKDLVALQLIVAAGNTLPFQQKDITLNGHAIEVRLCAEDVSRNFLPSAGKITHWDIPQAEAIRTETFVTKGKTISSNYDSLLAKIIVHDQSRETAIRKMWQTLTQSSINGVHTNQSFLLELLSEKEFQDNRMYTRYIDENLETINTSIDKKREKTDKHLLAAAFVVYYFLRKPQQGHSVWQQIGYWRMVSRITISIEESVFNCEIKNNDHTCFLSVNGITYVLSQWQLKEDTLEITINDKTHLFHLLEQKDHLIVRYEGQTFEIKSNSILQQAIVKSKDKQHTKVFTNLICAELFGKVLKLSVVEGQTVEASQVLLTLESMKTEIHVLSPVQGRIKKVHVKAGHTVSEKQIMLELDNVNGSGIL